METSKSGEFERSMAELDAIVKRLESENVPLDEAVSLFQKGRELARTCETLLTTAQKQIDAAANGAPPPAPGASPVHDEEEFVDEIPF